MHSLQRGSLHRIRYLNFQKGFKCKCRGGTPLDFDGFLRGGDGVEPFAVLADQIL